MTERESPSIGPERMASVRELVAEALKYWEPRRIAYNAVLAAVVIFYFGLEWPNSRTLLSIDSVLFLFILAVVANICYCAAYVVDVFVQLSTLRSLWLPQRCLLFALGTVFAAVITRFFALGFFFGSTSK
jgi:hypothetical protein